MANELKIVKSTTTTTVVDESADIAAQAVAGGAAIMDNSSEAYPFALATLHLPDGFVADPVQFPTATLFMHRMDTDGTADDTPAQDDAMEPVGTFRLHDPGASGTAQRRTISIDLGGALAAEFYLRNNADVAMDFVATNITVKITPYTYAPT